MALKSLPCHFCLEKLGSFELEVAHSFDRSSFKLFNIGRGNYYYGLTLLSCCGVRMARICGKMWLWQVRECEEEEEEEEEGVDK